MAQENKDIVAGGKTQAQIDKLKKQHGKLTLISTEDAEGKPLHIWLKKPNMNTVKAAAKLMQTSPLDAVITYGKNCLIDGDPGVFDDVDIITTISDDLMDLVEQRTKVVKNF